MTRNKIYCFVAIRLGCSDTDSIYDVIANTVSEFGLEPRRIDRIEHIDNINQKIISELNEADISIVDLTYARPSVYFEAGYAFRKIPVIYTCRKDHLRNEDDNLKIHFDTDRYPIVFWDNPDDRSFVSSLRSRLQYVIDNLVNVPLLQSLEAYFVHLNKSLLNPENILERSAKLFSQLKVYDRVAQDRPNHEINIDYRLSLYKDIFEMIEVDFSREFSALKQRYWSDLSIFLDDEIKYLEDLYERSNFGGKVMYANYLNELYKIYLECMTKLYRRPSNEYQSKYNRVKSGVEKLIRYIRNPI
jgi:hypothetical protein